MRNKRFIRLIGMPLLAVSVLGLPLKACPSEGRTLKIGIDEVSRMAIINNFDIQLYRIDKRINEKGLLKAKAVYDTALDFSYAYDEDRLKRSSIIFGKTITTVTQNASITKEIPAGTILSMGVSHTREASDSDFSSLNPYHESDISVSITQPIGKNRLGLIDRNNVMITRLDIENSDYTSTDKIERELADTQKAYWMLLLASKESVLTEQILASAKRLYASYKKNLDMGLIEQPEYYAVYANLKKREKDALAVNDRINTALNRMRLKLNLGRSTVVVPEDDFRDEPIRNSFEDIISIALSSRRDYRAAKNNVKKMDLGIEMKKSSLWPQIDLKGTLKKNGLDNDFDKSVREITSEDFPEYTAEVIFSFPLENRDARAEYSKKQLEKAKALIGLKKMECLILVETHDAFVHAQNAYNAMKLLEQASELQHKKYLGEEKRFKAGRSDTDRLIRYQDDYLGARLEYLRSAYEYQAALIGLKVAMNRLLQEV